jgi:membrane protease YdiL (CAAX protease family)
MTVPIIAAVRERAGELTRYSKPAIFLELMLATGLCFVRIFPFSVQILLLIFASLSLWLRGLTWSLVGLRKPMYRWWKVLLFALLSAVVICVLVNLLVGPFVERFAGKPPSNARFESIHANVLALMGWLAVTWTLAAFGEEMVFRGYLMNRISDLVGHGWAGWVSALLVSSLIFGAAHGYQGLAGAIGTAEMGLLLGAMYLLNRRNLWMNIVCHGFVDSISLIWLYFSAAI